MRTELIAVLGGSELDTLAALAKEIWSEYYPPIIGGAQTAYMLAKFQSSQAIEEQIKQGYFYYLIRAREDGRLLGYLAARPCADKKELFLSKFYLKSVERGKGFAKEALCFVEQIAGRMRLAKISLSVNKNNLDSQAVYERMGFKRTGAVITDIGQGYFMDDYILEKVLL